MGHYCHEGLWMLRAVFAYANPYRVSLKVRSAEHREVVWYGNLGCNALNTATIRIRPCQRAALESVGIVRPEVSRHIGQVDINGQPESGGDFLHPPSHVLILKQYNKAGEGRFLFDAQIADQLVGGGGDSLIAHIFRH